jgi:glutamate dehydrogenase (NADP+)
MTNKYLINIYENLKQKDKNEPEFLQAVYEVLNSIEPYINEHPELEQNGVIERFVEPERLITFRVPWVDDNGKVHVNRGYRVQFNSAIGPYKGGIRLHPSVNPSIMKFLGFEQTLKNSLTGLPMGGGKGGCDFDPRGKSDHEVMRFCQSFMTELFRHIGADTDVPAGDIGTGAREIGYMFGQYKRLKNEWTGVLTGKGLSYGGSIGRTSATGYGLCYFANKMLNVMKNTSLEGKKVIVSGSGNVGLYAAKKAKELGATVIAMNDISCYIYDPNGINLDIVQEIKEAKRGLLTEYINYDKNIELHENPKDMWKVKCDVALPCATQNEIDLEDAKALVAGGVIAVCEGANMPCTLDATNYLIDNKICFAPAKAANAGGVMVSGFEMSQNSMRLAWTLEEVDLKLKQQMENIFMEVHECAKHYDNMYNTVLGANISGFKKVAAAMLAQGVC